MGLGSIGPSVIKNVSFQMGVLTPGSYGPREYWAPLEMSGLGEMGPGSNGPWEYWALGVLGPGSTGPWEYWALGVFGLYLNSAKMRWLKIFLSSQNPFWAIWDH